MIAYFYQQKFSYRKLGRVMSLFKDAAKTFWPTAALYAVNLYWRWHTFRREVMKFRGRAVELDNREARRIARDRLLELAEGAAKQRGVYRFFTRELTKELLRNVIADVRAATRRREPREGPLYFTQGSESDEVERWTHGMNIASLTIDDEKFGMYGKLEYRPFGAGRKPPNVEE
jgi:hypothetical protein